MSDLSIFDVTSIVISIASLCFSVYVFFKNKLYSNAGSLLNIRDQVNQANSALAAARTDMSAFLNDTSDLAASVNTKYQESIATVLSVYENACILYYKHAVNRKNFVTLFRREVDNLFQSSEFAEAINQSDSIPNLTRFKNAHKK